MKEFFLIVKMHTYICFLTFPKLSSVIESTHVDGTTTTTIDPEYFRAIRGGLGGTFGVVTEFEYILYQTPHMVWVVFYVSMYHQGEPVGPEVIAFYLQWLQDLENVQNLSAMFSTHNLNRPNNSIGKHNK